MKKADLPSETAQEPTEEAHQPLPLGEKMASPSGSQQKKYGITFAEDTQSSEISSSQNNSSYKEVLSQPGPKLSHQQQLLWLQQRRGGGLWAQCDACDRWRFLPHVGDCKELPDKWFCKLNPDKSMADCSIPETSIQLREQEDLIHSEYSAGSVVWARFGGWPWWPAMVDDCPDTEQFYWLDGLSDIPTYYNVTFFDANDVTRAWITPGNLKPYSSNKKSVKPFSKKNLKYKKRIEVALKQADDAVKLPLANRLSKYCFLTRYRGPIRTPKKISKAELSKYVNKLKRTLNIDFSDEESDSDDPGTNLTHKRQEMKNKNVILVGTPKRPKHNKEIVDVDTISSKIIDFANSPTRDDPSQKPTDITDGVFKHPDSMTVQIGSTDANNTMTIDNDSSKTYLPESQVARSVEDSQDTTTTEIHVRIASPSSDDFDF